jgi:hypothetical protein
MAVENQQSRPGRGQTERPRSHDFYKQLSFELNTGAPRVPEMNAMVAMNAM